MIDSILKKQKRIVQTNRIVIPETSEEEELVILTNPMEIKTYIKNEITKWMAIPENSFPNWQEWQNEIASIFKHSEKIAQIEQDLMNIITEEEILCIITSTPNDKAPGPTGIQYKNLKQFPMQIIIE